MVINKRITPIFLGIINSRACNEPLDIKDLAKSGRASIVKELLNNIDPVKINTVSLNRAVIETAQQATKLGHIEVLKLLTNEPWSSQIDPSALGVALIEAARRGLSSTVELLMENPNSAKISVKDLQNALTEIGNENHYRLIKHFVNCSRFNDLRDCLINTLKKLFINLAKEGHNKAIEELISYVNAMDGVLANLVRDVLVDLADNGDHLALKLLLEECPTFSIKMDINALKDALVFASANGHHMAVELLLNDFRANEVSEKDVKAYSAFAKSWEHDKTVELLENNLLLRNKKPDSLK